MTRERVQKKAVPQERAPQEEHVEAPRERDEEAADVIDETDALLDEIDDLLEEHAEEFVRNYIQKGGQAVEVVRSLWRSAKAGFQLLPSLPQFKWTGV